MNAIFIFYLLMCIYFIKAEIILEMKKHIWNKKGIYVPYFIMKQHVF